MADPTDLEAQYLASLRRIVEGLDRKQRHERYKRARAFLAERLTRLEPPDVLHQRVALESAINAVEREAAAAVEQALHS